MISTFLVLGAPTLGGWAMWPAVVGTVMSISGWNAIAMLIVIRLTDGGMVGQTYGVVLAPFFLGLAVAPVAFGGADRPAGALAAGWGLQLAAATRAVVAAVRLRGDLVGG